MSERHKFCTKYLPRDCRNLLFFVEDGAANQWLGFGSRERYIAEGLGLDPQMVEWALAGLRRMRPEQADSLDEMVVLGKQGRLSDAPRDAKGRFLSGSPKGDNIIFGQRGTSSGYTLARLDRDGHTDLAAKVRSREISAHAAAIEAGFRRPTVTITDDVPRAAATIVRRWGPEHARRL
ncbi:MAG: hypothetical protein JO007_10535, partial [Alphaproteobacteria bacterium]|nr:hypothetical protein [Alphaproteobacteria bacterium]